MTLEQNFTDEDINKIEDVLLNIIKSTGNFNLWRKRWVKICLFALAGALILCCLIMYFVQRSFNGFMGLFSVGALFCILWSVFLDLIRKKMDKSLASAVRSKYKEPFTITMRNGSMIYRGIEFNYESITQAKEIDELLFLQVDKKWLVLKLQDMVKTELLTQLKNYEGIHFESLLMENRKGVKE